MGYGVIYIIGIFLLSGCKFDICNLLLCDKMRFMRGGERVWKELEARKKRSLLDSVGGTNNRLLYDI